MERTQESGLPPSKPRYSLSTHITVVVFWCLALVGLACSIFLLKDVEQDIVQDRQAVIERFTYRVESTLSDSRSGHGEKDLTAKLESLALRFGVEGVQLVVGDQLTTVGRTDGKLERSISSILPDSIATSALSTTPTLELYFLPTAELVKQQREQVLFSMGFLFLVFGAALQSLLARVLTGPMQRMVSIAQAVSEGETACRFDDTTGDEFAYLSGFINNALSELSYQASHDPVTGLYNRREFGRVLNRALQTAQRDGEAHALCYLDLDRFKLINDTCGHTAGDEFLLQLSEHLKQHKRKSDVLARLGGDEFAVLLQHCPLSRAKDVAGELRQTIQDFRFIWEQKCFHVGVSIGLVEIVDTSHSVVQIMSNADMACYAAKKAGRNRVRIYSIDDTELNKCRGEMAMASEISTALDEERLCLYFQPIKSMSGHQAADRYELLLRMIDSDGSMLLPDRFIPAAERFDLMPAMDRWVLQQACQFLMDQAKQGWKPAITVNLSGKSLCDPTFLEFAVEKVSQSCLDPGQLCFEITETVAIANLATANRFMGRLHGLGCRFALDNFGSGLSSFAYLKNLPVDYLKIDGSFIGSIVDSEVDRAMVEAINRVGHVLGMETVAERVDRAAVYEVLQELGVDYAQGYWLAMPQPLEQLCRPDVTVDDSDSELHSARLSAS